MQTVTTAEASKSLPELLEQVKHGPVLIREGVRDVAFLVSPESYESDRRRKIAKFTKLREEVAGTFQRNLAKDGLTVEQFLEELLK